MFNNFPRPGVCKSHGSDMKQNSLLLCLQAKISLALQDMPVCETGTASFPFSPVFTTHPSLSNMETPGMCKSTTTASTSMCVP